MLTPLKPTGFTVIFACFAFKSSQLFLNSFEDFGCLNVMSCDVSCVDIVIVTCFDGICSVLRLQIVRPTKSSNSNIDRMRTALWPNVNFKSLHEFLRCFCSFDTWLLDCGHLKILQTYYLMINMANISLAFLLCSFSLVVLLQLNTLDDVWVLGGPRTS